MTRHPTARRVHRPAAEPDDAFVAGVLETTVWAREHSRKIVIGGTIAAVVMIAAVLFVMNRRQTAQESVAQLTQVRAVAMSGNTELAIRDLQQFIDRYGSTPAAGEARLLLSAAYLEAGQQQNAINTVSRLVGNLDRNAGVNAAMLTAAAHEAAGEGRRAEEVLLRVAEDARFLYQRQDALDNVGRLRLQRNDAAGAVQIYERLVGMTSEGAAERQVYELRLGEATALAAAGATPAGSEPAGGIAPAGTPTTGD
ncbi:MAG TPA: tetratricopeptide repeat protein [Longimicrobiales bacterium]|nr:tetratricopeptide repeat protein [Longimicrobiales bacterium]